MACIAVLVSLLCVAFSAKRLLYVVSSTSLDVKQLASHLRGAGSGRIEAVQQALQRAGRGSWEEALYTALSHPSPAREAFVNEELRDLEDALRRWEHVPVTCARVSTTFGFLMGATTLREGLRSDGNESVESALFLGVVVVLTGVAGALVCLGLHRRALQGGKERARAVDEFLEQYDLAVRKSGESPASSTAQGGSRALA